MDIGEIFLEAVSYCPGRQAQHPVRYRRDISADRLSIDQDIIAPDDIGYHRNYLLVLDIAGVCGSQGFLQLFRSLAAVDDLIAHYSTY